MSSHDPDHYKVGGIESIDVIRAKLTPEQFEGFCLGNAMKYVHRAGHKGSKADDIKKASVYLEWAGEIRCKCDTPLSTGAILCADCNVAQLEADDGNGGEGWRIADRGPEVHFRWQVRNDGHYVTAFSTADEASDYIRKRKATS